MAYQRTIYKWKNSVGESPKRIVSSFYLLENLVCNFMICLCVPKQQEKLKKRSSHKGMGFHFKHERVDAANILS